MVCTDSILIEKLFFRDDVGITVAKKNVELKRESMGKLIIENKNDEKFIMNDLVYAPDLVANLLSVPQLRMNGYNLIFSEQIDLV